MRDDGDGLTFSGNGTATIGSGIDLTRYPLLAYSPLQWGEGVRVASNGASVEHIVENVRLGGEVLLMYALDAIAKIHRITLAELFDALRYARDQGMI